MQKAEFGGDVCRCAKATVPQRRASSEERIVQRGRVLLTLLAGYEPWMEGSLNFNRSPVRGAPGYSRKQPRAWGRTGEPLKFRLCFFFFGGGGGGGGWGMEGRRGEEDIIILGVSVPTPGQHIKYSISNRITVFSMPCFSTWFQTPLPSRFLPFFRPDSTW